MNSGPEGGCPSIWTRRQDRRSPGKEADHEIRRIARHANRLLSHDCRTPVVSRPRRRGPPLCSAGWPSRPWDWPLRCADIWKRAESAAHDACRYPSDDRLRFCPHARASAAGPAGHRRRGAHQYRPGAFPFRRAVAAGQPGHRGGGRHRLCRRWAHLLPDRAGSPSASPSSRRQALELAWRRSVAAARLWDCRAAGSTCAAL